MRKKPVQSPISFSSMIGGTKRTPLEALGVDVAPAPIEAPPMSRADLHDTAFRRLEPEICDCVKMVGIAMQLVMNNDEAADFAVGHLDEMLRRLKHEYYAAYHGDLDAIGRHAVMGDE